MCLIVMGNSHIAKELHMLLQKVLTIECAHQEMLNVTYHSVAEGKNQVKRQQ